MSDIARRVYVEVGAGRRVGVRSGPASLFLFALRCLASRTMSMVPLAQTADTLGDGVGAAQCNRRTGGCHLSSRSSPMYVTHELMVSTLRSFFLPTVTSLNDAEKKIKTSFTAGINYCSSHGLS